MEVCRFTIYVNIFVFLYDIKMYFKHFALHYYETVL